MGRGSGDLACPIGSPIRRTQDRYDRLVRDRRFGPGKADRDTSGLVGDGERIERGRLELAFDRGAKVGRRTHLSFEAAREDIAFDRLVDRSTTRGDPDTPAGK